MPDITVPRSGSNNGTATPATPGSITAVAGNLLLNIIAALGTSPTIAVPTSTGTWVQVQNVSGATLSFALFMQANNAGGAINPSSVLGGTVTGWISSIYEFTATGPNCGLQGSAQLTSAIAQLANIFPTSGNTLYNELFVYAIARATATLTANNTFMGNNLWSASLLPKAGIQGISLDFFFASGLGQGVGQYPSASGLLGGAVASVAIGAWFNSIASQPSNNDNNYGNNGVLVGGQYAGMIGG